MPNTNYMDSLKKIRKKGVGIIFYSTEIEEILLVCDVVHIMQSGRIIASINLREKPVDAHELTYLITSGSKANKKYETMGINGK